MTDGAVSSLAPPAPSARVSMRGAARMVGWGAICAVVLAWPYISPDEFSLTIGTLVVMAFIGAASLHLVIRTGQVSLAHAAFMGVGAYTSVLVQTRLGLPFPLNMVAAALVPAALALVIGPVLLRLTGKYFVLVTFLFGEIVRLAFTQWTSLTGGANGIFDIPALPAALATPVGFYYLAAGIALISVGLVMRILASEIGRSIDSVREAERLAACAGIPVLRVKTMAFVLACGLVGIQGALSVYHLHYVDPTGFTTVQSLNFVIMNVIGSMENIAGPLLGAVFLVAAPELLRGYVELQYILFGLALVVVMAVLPGGLLGLFARAVPWRRP
jgi:branched-chain amino acid transport system permease protein